MGADLSPRRRVDLAGLAASGGYLVLAWASHAPPVSYPSFFGPLVVAWGSLAAVWCLASDALPLRRIVLWCLVFRAIGLASEPVLEDDALRYLWDGRSFALTGNPYADAPADHFGDADLSPRFEQILDGVNHPDVPTLYAPVAELIFLMAHWIAPGELWSLKLLLLVADVVGLWSIARMTGDRGALLWAWCPLLVVETAFTAHFEVVGLALLVTAFKLQADGRGAGAAVALALAVATRPFVALLAPLFGWRSGGRGVVPFLLALAAVYLPFLGSEAAAEGPGLATFAGEWEFNSTFFAILADVAGVELAWGVAVLAALLVAAGLIVRDRGGLPRGEIAFGICFLFAPVVNPWYLLWLLPFVCARPSLAGSTAMAVVTLAYVHGLFLPGGALPAYHHPIWVRPVELALIAGALGIDLFRRRVERSRLEEGAGGPSTAHSGPRGRPAS